MTRVTTGAASRPPTTWAVESFVDARITHAHFAQEGVLRLVAPKHARLRDMLETKRSFASTQKLEIGSFVAIEIGALHKKTRRGGGFDCFYGKEKGSDFLGLAILLSGLFSFVEKVFVVVPRKHLLVSLSLNTPR